MEQNPKQQVVERIKSATNILVTVNSNPSVDQLAACIGFTLLLNKLGKHATAVFSGKVPSTLEFLQPEKTLETNTDSLQDFIIALDKSKADKLRYKVEDDVVRIFITPYRTSISEKDLDFSQGDFNVDVVVALGVINKEDIDQAIIMHGRILHDAVVMSVTDGEVVSSVGSINWNDMTASSLSEMLVSISESFQSGLLDPQMATAFLTGIVAETERFSNEKTSPKVMTMSAQLMAAGANQQLIATKLAPPPPEPVRIEVPVEAPAPVEAYVPPEEPKAAQEPGKAAVEPAAEVQEAPEAAAPEHPKPDGELDIFHQTPQTPAEPPENEDEIHIDDQGNLKREDELKEAQEAIDKAALKAAEQAEQVTAPEPAAAPPPPEDVDKPVVQVIPGQDFIATSPHKVIAPLTAPSDDEKLDSIAVGEPDEAEDIAAPANVLPLPAEPAFGPPEPDQTLTDLEAAVHSPHVETPGELDEARQAVLKAGLEIPPRPVADIASGAQVMHVTEPDSQAAPSVPELTLPTEPSAPMTGIADILQQTSSGAVDAIEAPEDPMKPPPVPPPMTMPYFEPTTSHHNPYLNPPTEPDPNASQDQ